MYKRQDFRFSDIEIPKSIFLPNKTRQFLEFVRRSGFEDLKNKQKAFDDDLLSNAQIILQALEEYHL